METLLFLRCRHNFTRRAPAPAGRIGLSSTKRIISFPQPGGTRPYEELARRVQDIEERHELTPFQTRALVCAAIEARYTLPA